MDEVDQIVAAWRRERPDVEVTPLEIFSRLTRLTKHLERVRKQAFATHGLELWEWDVLSALRRSGEPYELSPGHLVAATMVTSGTMTNRVDRLVERGLVQRRPAPSDRRGVLVRLTADGRTRVDGALRVAAPPDRVGDLAARAGLALHLLTEDGGGLEEVFLQLTAEAS